MADSEVVGTKRGAQSASEPMEFARQAPGKNYRADIDGLRAIAVISVVLYHLGVPFIEGGFLGVDVFFVISGHLITRLIWGEIGEHRFSLREFYIRRARRIMPAMIVMLVFCVAISIVILLPIDLLGFARSIFATIAFSANIFFWRDGDYFSRASEEKPLLHMWSLGIEEQFYLLFPLILFSLRGFGRRRATIGLWVVLACSFALNMFASAIGAENPAFYLLPTRAWELIMGALLSVSNWHPRAGNASLAAAIGGAALIAALALGRATVVGGSPVATLAVFGTALIIASGSAGPNPITTLLSGRPVVALGLISYSLYLWHWPLIVFTRYWLVGELKPLVKLAVFVVAITLAGLSWYIIERPFRSQQLTLAKFGILTFVGTAVIVLFAGVILVGDGFPQRLSPAAAAVNAAVGTNFRCPVHDYIVASVSRGCALNIPNRRLEDAQLLLIGNSHALMYAPLVRDLAARHRVYSALLNANSCLPSADVNLNVSCTQQASAYINSAAALPAKIVFIGLNWDPGTSRMVSPNGRAFRLQGVAGVVAAVSATVDRLSRVGKTVVVIGPIATPGWDVASTVSRSIAFRRQLQKATSTSRIEFDRKMAIVFNAFGGRSDLIFVRPDEVQCGPNQCSFLLSGRSLFADDNHLAQPALKLFEPEFRSALEEALNRYH